MHFAKPGFEILLTKKNPHKTAAFSRIDLPIHGTSLEVNALH
jgi:hypothetical protein